MGTYHFLAVLIVFNALNIFHARSPHERCLLTASESSAVIIDNSFVPHFVKLPGQRASAGTQISEPKDIPKYQLSCSWAYMDR